MATIVLVGTGTSNTNDTVDTASTVAMRAGHPLLVWVTASDATLAFSAVTGDPTGTPLAFTFLGGEGADSGLGTAPVRGSLWALDAPSTVTAIIRATSVASGVRRQLQVYEVSAQNTSAPDAWRAGLGGLTATTNATTHEIVVATLATDLALAFLAIRSPLTRNAATALVNESLAGATLRGVVLTGSDPSGVTLGGTTAFAADSIMVGLSIASYVPVLPVTVAPFTLTGRSASLIYGATSTRTMTADAGAFTLAGPAVALTLATAGALPSLSLGPFANAVPRLFIRATAIEANSTAVLNPTSGWTALPGTESRVNALAIMARAEYTISSALNVTSAPTIAVLGDNASVLAALVSLPSFVLVADVRALTLTGTATGLRAAKTLTADVATFVLVGTDLAYLQTHTLQAVAAAFVWTGTNTGLVSAALRTIIATPLAMTLTGFDALLISAPTITANSVSLVLAGTPAILSASRLLSVESGFLALDYPDPIIAHGRAFTVDTTNYALAFPDVAFSTVALSVPVIWNVRARVLPSVRTRT